MAHFPLTFKGDTYHETPYHPCSAAGLVPAARQPAGVCNNSMPSAFFRTMACGRSTYLYYAWQRIAAMPVLL